MKDENEGWDQIEKSSSSTSEVVESVDLTVYPTTSGLNDAPQSTRSEQFANKTTADHAAVSVFETVLDAATSSRRLPTSQPNLRGPRSDFLGAGLINSTNLMHSETYVKRASCKKSVGRIPPSYSTVLKLGPPIAQFDDSRTYPSVAFVTRQPPPSYAEVQHGAWDENPSLVSADSFSLGPEPLYVSCPRCRTIVVSDIQTERSHLSYIVSMVLCVCLCWPCCLLPFCLKSCKNTYHFCPTCHYYLGAYRPC